MSSYDWYAALGKPLLPGESRIPYQFSFKSGTEVTADLSGKQLLATCKNLTLGQVSALQDVVGNLFYSAPRDQIEGNIDKIVVDALTTQYARFAHLDAQVLNNARQG